VNKFLSEKEESGGIALEVRNLDPIRRSADLMKAFRHFPYSLKLKY